MCRRDTAWTAAEKEVWGFSGNIPTIDALAWICTTIAWTASGHHAAVNFGQASKGHIYQRVPYLLFAALCTHLGDAYA